MKDKDYMPKKALPLQNDFSMFEFTGDDRLTPAATHEQVVCYRQLFAPCGEQSIIADVACGDGRHTLPLAAHYKEVVGVDIDKELLQNARNASIEEKSKNIRFVEGDMRNLPFDDRVFDGVLNGLSSWGFYGFKDDLQALSEMSRVLKPGGVLVLDYGNIEARLREIKEKGAENEVLNHKVVYDIFISPDGKEVIRTSWVDADLWYHWICQKVGDSNPLIVGVQQGYHKEELTRMFQKAGLKPTGMYGNYDLGPVNDQNKRLIIRAVKQ